MKHFYVITNISKDPDLYVTREVCRILRAHDVQAVTAQEQPDIPEKTECIIVLGGDGTVLQAAGKIAGRPIPILGINLGTLGYLAEVERRNLPEALEELLSGRFEIEERMMLDGTAPDGTVHCALNDVVFSRSGPLRILNYDVYVNGQFLNSFNADGIIVSTPTGSTAYNLSAGGPIVEPSARMILMTPICPHTLNNRSIVLPAEDRIEVEIGRTSTSPDLAAEADFDGSAHVQLHTGDRMTIRQSARSTHLIRLSKRSFLETLHKKMINV